MIVPLAWMGVLWFLSSLPSTGERDLAGITIAPLVQNGAHAVAYAVLAAAWLWALAPSSWGAPVWAFLVCVGYGVVDELHQAFVPGRTSSVLDVLTNAAGAAIALALLAAAMRRHTLSLSRAEPQP